MINSVDILVNDAILLNALASPRLHHNTSRCYFSGEECNEDDCEIIHGKLVCRESIESIKSEGEDPEEVIRELVNWTKKHFKLQQ